MIFPESELSTYLGFFVPGGQVEPLLDRIAEASSDFEELNLVGFLHLAQRELELTGDVNRDDAAVVLIEELQLPLADAAAVLEENPAATAARLQSAWAEVPDQHTGPLPNLMQDGLIMLEPGLELDDSLVLDPSLSIINPKPAALASPSTPVELLGEDVEGHTATDGEADGPAHDVAVDEEATDDTSSQSEPDDPGQVLVELEAIDGDDDSVDAPEAEPGTDAPAVMVEVFPAAEPSREPELVIAPEPEDGGNEGAWAESPGEEALPGEAIESDGMVGVPATEPEMVPGPAMAFAPDADEVYDPVPEGEGDTSEHDADAIEALEEHNPYAALSPESLEGSSQSFPWDPLDHGQPITAAALLALDDDPALTQGPSQPITHVTGRIPVAEILDGESDGIAAFPSHHVASAVPLLATHEAAYDAMAGHVMEGAGSGDTVIIEDAPTAQPDPEDVVGHEADHPIDEPPVEPLLALVDEDDTEDPSSFDLMDAFGGVGMPDQTPPFPSEDYSTPSEEGEGEDAVGDTPDADDAGTPSDGNALGGVAQSHDLPEAPYGGDYQAEYDDGATYDDLAESDEALADDDGRVEVVEPTEGETQGRRTRRTVIRPYWMRGQAEANEAPATTQPVSTEDTAWADAPSEEPLDQATAQGEQEDLADASWADQPFPEHPDERDGEDTQQLPAMDLIAQIAAENQQAVIGANLAPEQGRSPSVERFLDDLHGSWIAGGNDVLERPVSDMPLGGRVEVADPPAPHHPSASPVAVPAPPRPRRASGADLTNDEAVEATYEEEFVPEPPAPAPPPPAAVWIPGMADRAFRSTPWHQIEDDPDGESGDEADLHGFGAAAMTPVKPVVRQSPAEKIQDADVAAFMAGGPADAPEWDGPEEGIWAHADYGPKRPKANRVGQVSGLLALALAAGVIYLAMSWSPFMAAITALGLPVHPLVVVGALAGVLGIGGLSMFIGSSIPKQPKVKVVRRRRRKRRDDEPAGDGDTYLDNDQDIVVSDDPETAGSEAAEELTDIWEEDLPPEP